MIPTIRPDTGPTGYVCKQCHEPSPTGVGWSSVHVPPGLSTVLYRCDCGYSRRADAPAPSGPPAPPVALVRAMVAVGELPEDTEWTSADHKGAAVQVWLPNGQVFIVNRRYHRNMPVGHSWQAGKWQGATDGDDVRRVLVAAFETPEVMS
ncbi:hypothetical protein [Tomitella gaofuii]|uniref:hypothetical protein n=1 Tax=Tomitella gaofuii TaxID=2760083 RepID=UPI0015FCDE50|nr:hypothetical protein [Tomitella gaofuii]